MPTKKSKADKPSNSSNAKASTSQPKASSEIDDIFSKKKPAGEIDDIFAKKHVEQKAVDSASTASSSHKSGKEKKEGAVDQADDSQAVEEVVFAELAAVKASKKRASQPKVADDDGFGDSRGKKSKRTTDDGYPLYDVKELNIGLGGDTPECPFDCKCCF
ncbi:hypothetical protein K450DRAFT_219971 [Umbelopsis ramanniana AG]|uniref:DUF1764-domain-containing protein n=1 Tax=Umbelopsis ramanniana AG TaxID=1314678 RepID=A0AAD5HI73_UMBRA|nr:uncharacterized protein K450DRAFT_219971 [Umbelopsis ramanniana AG]KAI8583784.1 hypothetical protein K450DRAFT_219971 [Umbelopsis ramanniana AG]